MYNFASSYLDSSLYSTPSYGAPTIAVSEGVQIWSIIALVLAIVGGILVYFLFIRSKTAAKGKFAKWLKDFLSFKIMWIEPILKVVYYAATIYAMLLSFSFLGLGGYGFLAFLVCLILVPICIRLAYEAAMMFIMIWRNTRDIAENTEKKK
ncbi:hypothetical protein IKE72_00485 [Candidatus Saccharibacteria bacterium]|nr:hypothetical protein [Candidatus Saccharibacteria bacterium]